MHSTTLNLIWSSVSAHWSLYGFLLITAPLVGLLALDYSKNGKVLARQGADKERFLAPYRDADGMPVYFDMDTYDPESPLYSTRRKRYQARTISQ